VVLLVSAKQFLPKFHANNLDPNPCPSVALAIIL